MRKSLLVNIAAVINYVVIILLLLSYLSKFINPLTNWIPALIGLGFPIYILANLFFIVFWLFVRPNRMALLSFLTIIIGFTNIGLYYQFKGKNTPGQSEQVKVLTYNIHNYNPPFAKAANYNKNSEEAWADKMENQEKVIRFFNDQKANILCLQEFSSIGKNYYDLLKEIKSIVGARHYYFESYYNPKANAIYGLAIFSRFNVVNKGVLEHDDTRKFGIYLDVVWGQDTIRVYNLHLESVKLSPIDYELLVGERSSLLNDQSSSKKIVKKAINAFKSRAKQVDVIRQSMAECPYKMIVCGDFNDTPVSYAYTKIKGDLTDAFVESGQGNGKTLSGKLPVFRIDYILHDDAFNSYECQTEQISFSDHYPVSCILTK